PDLFSPPAARRASLRYVFITRTRPPPTPAVGGPSPVEQVPDMATTTSLSFFDRLANSQLLDAEQLAGCRAAAAEGDKALAEHLLGHGLLTRFQVRQLRAGATNFIVGKYVVLDCVGRGANGIVYKARHRLMPDR